MDEKKTRRRRFEDQIPEDVREHARAAREQLGEEGFEALAAEGRGMTIEQLITYALEDMD